MPEMPDFFTVWFGRVSTQGGGRGGKNPQKSVHVVYEQSLIRPDKDPHVIHDDAIIAPTNIKDHLKTIEESFSVIR